MAQQPRLYESTFVVNASLEDLQIDAAIEKAKDVIAKNGGTVSEVAKWGRKRFAYPIRKKNNGFYVVTEFTGSGEIVPKLERHFQLDDNILRYIVVSVDPKAGTGRIKATDLGGPKEVAATETVPEAPKPVAAV